MKKITLIALLMALTLTAAAQKLSFKDFAVLPTDAKASNDQRPAPDGTPCALLRVRVVGVKDMTFTEAVGDVAYSVGEYLVYVPAGTKNLHYAYGRREKGVIDLDDMGYGIEKLTTYLLQFETQDKLRSAVFSVSPADAALTVNGKEVALDKNGLAEVELPIGEYDYSVKASGHNEQAGKVSLVEESVSTLTTIALEQRKHQLRLTSNVPTANVFVDDIPYGTVNPAAPLNLPEGHHTLRISAETYNDYVEELDVQGDLEPLYAELVQMKQKTIVHNNERTRTSINLRNAAYAFLGGTIYDKDAYCDEKEIIASLDVKFHYMWHFFGIFAYQTGFEVGLLFDNDDDDDDNSSSSSDEEKDNWALNATLPLQADISFPFGAYNKNMVSILGGAYGSLIYIKDDGNTSYDCGLRATLRVDINKFSISADVNQSLKDRGFFGGLSLGYKFY